MSHLVVHVLTEAQLVFGDANFSEVEVDPPDEVSQDGVVDHSLKEHFIVNLPVCVYREIEIPFPTILNTKTNIYTNM